MLSHALSSSLTRCLSLLLLPSISLFAVLLSPTFFYPLPFETHCLHSSSLFLLPLTSHAHLHHLSNMLRQQLSAYSRIRGTDPWYSKKWRARVMLDSIPYIEIFWVQNKIKIWFILHFICPVHIFFRLRKHITFVFLCMVNGCLHQ